VGGEIPHRLPGRFDGTLIGIGDCTCSLLAWRAYDHGFMFAVIGCRMQAHNDPRFNELPATPGSLIKALAEVC
jgi:hypothetical protein